MLAARSPRTSARLYGIATTSPQKTTKTDRSKTGKVIKYYLQEAPRNIDDNIEVPGCPGLQDDEIKPPPALAFSPTCQDPDCSFHNFNTPCPPQSWFLPDPHRPPAERDNTSIWEAVMARKGPSQSQSIAQSAGARGSERFDDFLVKLLGEPLKEVIQYTVTNPASHFQHEAREQGPRKYAPMFTAQEAKTLAENLQFLLRQKPSESDLSTYLIEKLFRSPDRFDTPGEDHMIPFGENATLRKTEYTNPFRGYNASEVKAGITAITHICLLPNERLLGLPNLPPAETDMRGRCDMVFGLSEMCLSDAEDSAAAQMPCHDPSAGIMCIWLRVEFKKNDDEPSRRAARHQWAVGAYISLQARLRLAPIDSSTSYLQGHLSTDDIRHYGYVICGTKVEIWEMKVLTNGVTKAANRRQTIYDVGKTFFTFPARRITDCSLDKQFGVEKFCRWHSEIMYWGVEIYGRQYFNNVEHLMEHEPRPERWTLSHSEATNRFLPSHQERDPEEADHHTAEADNHGHHYDYGHGHASLEQGPLEAPRLKGSLNKKKTRREPNDQRSTQNKRASDQDAQAQPPPAKKPRHQQPREKSWEARTSATTAQETDTAGGGRARPFRRCREEALKRR